MYFTFIFLSGRSLGLLLDLFSFFIEYKFFILEVCALYCAVRPAVRNLSNFLVVMMMMNMTALWSQKAATKITLTGWRSPLATSPTMCATTTQPLFIPPAVSAIELCLSPARRAGARSRSQCGAGTDRTVLLNRSCFILFRIERPARRNRLFVCHLNRQAASAGERKSGFKFDRERGVSGGSVPVCRRSPGLHRSKPAA